MRRGTAQSGVVITWMLQYLIPAPRHTNNDEENYLHANNHLTCLRAAPIQRTKHH
jgi:hypothetical protein